MLCAMCMLGRNNVLQTVYIEGQVTGHASRSTLGLTAVGSMTYVKNVKVLHTHANVCAHIVVSWELQVNCVVNICQFFHAGRS